MLNCHQINIIDIELVKSDRYDAFNFWVFVLILYILVNDFSVMSGHTGIHVLNKY